MSSLLHNLQECTRLITSDKITERRKQIDELPFILSNRDVLEALDKNGDRKDRVTWKRLFKSVNICVQKEIDCMEKDHKKSPASNTTRDRKQRALTCLVRLVISQSNSRGEPKLATATVVEHLLTIMRSEFAWNMLSADYSNILLKEVLAHRRISRDISPAALDEFIQVYTSYYRTSEAIAHHDLVMNILVAVIRLSYFQTVLDASLLFVFFKDIVLKSRSSLMISQQESLMSTCLTFCKSVAVDCRIQLCYFGEIVFDSVLAMLEDNVSKNFKTILIDFLQLQMVCHHPRGAVSEAEGMFSCDSELWKRNLHRLYLQMLKELQRPAFRGRHSTKNLGLDFDFLELLVDVFNAEVVLETDEACSSSSPSAKRRRTVHGFSFLLDTIQNVGAETCDLVAWLHLIGGCLRKYPDATATSRELVSAIGILHQLQIDCKRYAIMSPLLDCIRHVLGTYLHLRSTKCRDDSKEIWNKIYELTVRTVSLNHCIKEGHELLAALVSSKILNPGPELSCFFTPGVSPISSSSLQTLATILSNSDLMRLIGSRRMNGRGRDIGADPLEVRFRLLDWLLPNYLEDNSPSIFKTNDAWSITLHAWTLGTLAVSDGDRCFESVQRLHSSFREECSLEDVYLQATCDLEAGRQNVDVGNVDSNSTKSNGLSPVQAKMMEYLIRDCSGLLDSELSLECQDVVTVSAQCCLVVKCIGHLVITNALSLEGLIDLPVRNDLRKLMARLGDLLHNLCISEEDCTSKQKLLTVVVSNLQNLYAWDGNLKYRQTMSDFCRDVTSEKLLDVFFDYLFVSTLSKSGGGVAVAINTDPDFVCLDDTVNNNNTADFEPTFFPFFEFERFFGNDANRGLIEWPTSDVERLQLDVTRLLTSCCENSSPNTTFASRTTEVIQRRIFESLLEKEFNMEVPFNVHLVFTVMAEFVRPVHTLNEKCFGDLLMILREVCKVHSKDGEISSVCLTVLSALTLRLNEFYVARGFGSSVDELVLRDHVLRLLNAFCTCKSQGNCGPYAELGIVKVLAALAKCDRRFLRTESAILTVNKCPNPSLIPSFLKSKHFLVSFEAGRSLQLLLKNRLDSNQCDTDTHDVIFGQVLASIEDAAVAREASLHHRDLQANWTWACVNALKHVVIGSSFYLKPVLFAMSMHAKEVKSSIPVIRKALKTIASFLKYPSVTHLMDTQIVYLVDRCLREDQDLKQCVWQLTDSKTLEDFYKNHYRTIVPVVFGQSKWERFRAPICEALNCSPVDVVTDCFPSIMTTVFAGYVAGSVAHKRTARSCHDLAEAILSKPVLDEQTASRLDEIVVSLLKCIHLDRVDHDETIALPSGSPPAHRMDIVDASLTYLMNTCDDQNASLVSVLCVKPDGIQKVLLALETYLDGSYEPHDVYQAVITYKFFVSLVWKEFGRGTQAIWEFVLRDVIMTLLHLLERCESRREPAMNAVVWECCGLLQDIAISAVDVFANEFAKLVSLIINGLIPHAVSAATDRAISVINCLIVDLGDRLRETVVHLEPFPDLPVFTLARDRHVKLKNEDGPLSLKQEIDHFLLGLELPNEGHFRPEGLRCLRLQLASRADELKRLVRELQGLHFADDCSGNVIYRLLVELVHLCCDGSVVKDEAVVVEAARCLGELGPIPLSTAVLQSNKTRSVTLNAALQHFQGDPSAQRNCLIFYKLWTYSSDSSVRVKAVSSRVLKSALSTKSGQVFVAKYKSQIGLFPLFRHLHPFVSNKASLCPSSSSSSSAKRMSDDEFIDLVDVTRLWRPEQVKFDEYIVRLCSTLIETGVHGCEILRHLQPVCTDKVDFCVAIFPYLIHSIFQSADCDGSGHCFQSISRQIDGFFDHFTKNCLLTSAIESSSETPVCLDKRALNVMLNTVLFLRLQKRPSSSKGRRQTSWDDNYRLDLNYLHVAQAAHFCAAHFSALLFVEIWYEGKSRMVSGNGSRNQSQEECLSSGSSYVSLLTSICPDETKTMQDLLMRIYRGIGDPDAIYGCGMSHWLDADVRLQFYEHERRWDRALFAYDLSLRSPATTSASVPIGMPRTLQKLGLHHLSDVYFENASGQEYSSTTIREFQLECAWKNTRWNESTAAGTWLSGDDNLEGGFHESVHCGLNALRRNDQKRFRNLCSRALRAVVLDLRQDGSVECLAGLGRPLTQLITLSNLEDITDDGGSVDNVLSKWSARDTIVDRDYDVMDQVLAVRNAVLQILSVSRDQRNPPVCVSSALVNCEERQAELARKNGLFQLAETHISRLRRRSDSTLDDGSRFASGWKLEEAKIFWDGKEHDTAKSLLSIVIRELEDRGHENSELYARALGLYGNWLIETHSKNASLIMENFLEKSITLLEQCGSRVNAETIESLMNGYVTTARYADAHYTRIVDYLKSSDYERKQQLAIDSKGEARRLKASGNMSKEKARSFQLLMKQSEIDNKELESMREDRLRFLVTSAQNYAKCLALGTSEDTRVFRLVSLWFQNREVADLNATVKDLAARIPSHKFLPLVYQLAARLGSNALRGSDFGNILQQIIERMTLDHPYHTLLVILALSNATKDDDYLSTTTTSTSRSKKPEETDRAVAARDLLNRVRTNDRVGPVVSDAEKVCDALIAFSYCKSGNTCKTFTDDVRNHLLPCFSPSVSTTDQKIDRDQPLMKLRRLYRIPPLTLGLSVDPTCNYDDVPGTLQYLDKFSFCGGINHPKKVGCRGTDGVLHTQLVKGNDDMRQDAVMQQVFVHVNELLNGNVETARRHLSIRTYKVVPLTQRSGVLEWCANTMPLKEYLLDNKSMKGAHSRYHPEDWPVAKCQDTISAVASKSFQQKYEIYLQVCRQLKPVFRHFFLENFPEAPIWYERRMAYVRSVATNSIVGYILGLGDRHVSNILVDKRSAELVHIDLGVAFEQGRVLPTPETVPFRLTRDLVDGMGITGIEGPFRRCCEKTMDVMRSSHEVVLTILEVLLYDPLYQWSLTPLKACKIQDARERISSHADTASIFVNDDGDASLSLFDHGERKAGEDINKLAERALCRLRQKLRGVEDDGTALSVSGQVSHLIQEAMDPRNLCRLFKGWQAYL